MQNIIKQLIDRLTQIEEKIRTQEASEEINYSIALLDGVTAPSTDTNNALIYVDTSDGDLKVKFSDGTVKTIVTDT